MEQSKNITKNMIQSIQSKGETVLSNVEHTGNKKIRITNVTRRENKIVIAVDLNYVQVNGNDIIIDGKFAGVDLNINYSLV